MELFTDVWTFASPPPSARPGNHPTPKPLSLMAHLVGSITRQDDIVLDPFMGSGTTLRAAKDLGRKAIGIEIDERSCEIAAKRCAQEVIDFGVSKHGRYYSRHVAQDTLWSPQEDIGS